MQLDELSIDSLGRVRTMQLDELSIDSLVVLFSFLPSRSLACMRLVSKKFCKAGNQAATTLYSLSEVHDAATVTALFPQMVYLSLGRQHDPNESVKLVEALGASMSKRPYAHRVLKLETGTALLTSRLGKSLGKLFPHLTVLKLAGITGLGMSIFKTNALPMLHTLSVKEGIDASALKQILEMCPNLMYGTAEIKSSIFVS